MARFRMFTLADKVISFDYRANQQILRTKQAQQVVFGRCVAGNHGADIRLPFPLLSREAVKLVVAEDGSARIVQISGQDGVHVCVRHPSGQQNTTRVDKDGILLQDGDNIEFSSEGQTRQFTWKQTTSAPKSGSLTPMRSAQRVPLQHDSWLKSFATPARGMKRFGDLGSPMRVPKRAKGVVSLETPKKLGLKEALKEVFARDDMQVDEPQELQATPEPVLPMSPRKHDTQLGTPFTPKLKKALLNLPLSTAISNEHENLPSYAQPTVASHAKHVSPPPKPHLRAPPKTADPVRVRHFNVDKLHAIASPMRARQVRDALFETAQRSRSLLHDALLKTPELPAAGIALKIPSNEHADGSSEQKMAPLTPAAGTDKIQITPSPTKPKLKPTLEPSSAMKKTVRFGPALQPEVFDKAHPPSTPVARGAKPMGTTPLKSLLKRNLAEHEKLARLSPITSPTSRLATKLSPTLSPRRSPEKAPSPRNFSPKVSPIKPSKSVEIVEPAVETSSLPVDIETPTRTRPIRAQSEKAKHKIAMATPKVAKSKRKSLD